MISTTVNIRGQELEVEYQADSDDGGPLLDWYFVDTTPAQLEAMNLTNEEEAAILDQLWKHYNDWCQEDPDIDRV